MRNGWFLHSKLPIFSKISGLFTKNSSFSVQLSKTVSFFAMSIMCGISKCFVATRNHLINRNRYRIGGNCWRRNVCVLKFKLRHLYWRPFVDVNLFLFNFKCHYRMFVILQLWINRCFNFLWVYLKCYSYN